MAGRRAVARGVTRSSLPRHVTKAHRPGVGRGRLRARAARDVGRERRSCVEPCAPALPRACVASTYRVRRLGDHDQRQHRPHRGARGLPARDRARGREDGRPVAARARGALTTRGARSSREARTRALDLPRRLHRPLMGNSQPRGTVRALTAQRVPPWLLGGGSRARRGPLGRRSSQDNAASAPQCHSFAAGLLARSGGA